MHSRLLAVCCLLATALASGACAAEEPRPLVVLGPWTDGEAVPFEAALAAISADTGVRYTYKGTRSLRETLVSQIEAGDPPDVAILNSSADLGEYARESAHPLPPDREALGRADVKPWAPEVDEQTYWIPVKIDLKSLVWTRDAEGSAPAAAPRWCLGLASDSTSGWPGTDWIEDLLLHQKNGPTLYEEWARGDLPWTSDEVRRAWRDFGDMLFDLEGSARRDSLAKPWHSADLLKRDPKTNRPVCTHELQASFMGRYYIDHPDIRPVPSAPYLPVDEAERADPTRSKNHVVSGDMAMVLEQSDAAWDLLEGLISPHAREVWIRKAEDVQKARMTSDKPAAGAELLVQPPLFPATKEHPEPETHDPLTQELRKLLGSADQVCYDASDAMPPTLRTAFYNAVLDYVQGPPEQELAGLDAQQKRQRYDALLDQLLQDLERERQLQEADEIGGAPVFLVSHLCEKPPKSGAESSG